MSDSKAYIIKNALPKESARQLTIEVVKNAPPEKIFSIPPKPARRKIMLTNTEVVYLRKKYGRNLVILPA